MDVKEPGVPPLKDRGNMVTSVVSPKMTEGTNNSDGCTEEIAKKTAELHNGETSESVVGSKTKSDTDESAKKSGKEDLEHAKCSSDKWKMQFDLSDTASSSDSEVDTTDKIGEHHKGGLSTLMDEFMEEDEDFKGFDAGADTTSENIGAILKKLLDLTDSSEASTSHDGNEEIYYHTLVPVVDEDGVECDEKQKCTFILKVVSKPPLSPVEHELKSRTNTERPDSEDSENSELTNKKTKKKVKGKLESSTSNLSFSEGKSIAECDGGTSDTTEKMLVDETNVDGTLNIKEEPSPSKPAEEMSEVTSSANSSPSLSSRSSMKASGRYSRGVSPALSLSGGRGKKSIVDMSNPAFLKPFELGWRRELVFRNSSDSSFKKMADIYYYTPAGKKVRSTREVAEYLDGVDLTIDNFTFFKEPIGLNDPAKEVIRDAKKVLMKDPNSTPVKKTPKPKQSTPPVPVTPPVTAPTPSSEPQAAKVPPQPRSVPPKTFPKIKVSSVRIQRLPNFRPSSLKQKKSDSKESGDLEMGMLPPNWNKSSLLKKSQGNSQNLTWSAKSDTSKKTITEPCSIRCLGVMGLIPSLQCRLCLCLYHPECVGLGTITETIHSYVCKNCQTDTSVSSTKVTASAAPPPPLTPISALGSGNKSSAVESTPAVSPSSPPKLQRLPRLNESGRIMTVPHFVKIPKCRESLLTPQSGSKATGTIVGSVTTWLPPSSTIQLTPSAGAKPSSAVTTSVSSSSSTSDTLATPPSSAAVQSVACMGGKKYIVVPKHNVLSVSPAMAATATTPASKSSVQSGDASPLGDKAPATLVVSNPTTVMGASQAIVGPPQVLVTPTTTGASSHPLSLVQTSAPGGPALPTPSAYLVSTAPPPGGLQNPPGVLLVPFMGSGSPFLPSADTVNKAQQYLILNGPSGNFIIGNMQPPPLTAVPKPVDPEAREAEESTEKSKRKLSSTEQDGPSAKVAKITKTPTLGLENSFFMNNICSGYSSLLHVFEYLKVQDLLRTARVCRMWRDISSHASLWHTVRMKNSQVRDWEGLVNCLKRHETQHLDLRKMLLVPNEDSKAMWDKFLRYIVNATSLQRLDLCRCPARVIEKVAEKCPQLKVINALAIKCSKISLQPFTNHKNLLELRLKSQSSSFELTSTLAPLKNLSSLKHLSLTTLKDLGNMDPYVLGTLRNLESLELGECCDFPEDFGPDALSRLKKLERLRLEKGQGQRCPTFSILEGIATLPKLNHLELINFDVKPGFDKALGQCKNIHRLLIIPTYVTQSATTNHMVLNGVISLRESLVHFVWGVTHELLRVTELFVDQCEGQKDSKSKSGKKSSNHDSIPILKPIHQPGQNDCATEDSEDKEGNDDAKASAAAPQVEILPLPKLQKLLTTSLPKTKVRILKIPFHATWRQTISEAAL